MPSLSQLHGPSPRDRRQWQDALLNIVSPAIRVAALGPGRQPVHGTNHDPHATWFELLARPLWGLSAHAAGGGQAPELWADIRTTLAAAVDPAHAWYVGAPRDRDQRLVESAAVGVALALSPEQMWAPMTDNERRNLAVWLSAGHRCSTFDNNWHLFPVLATLGLDRIDSGVAGVEQRTPRERELAPASDPDLVERHMDRIEAFGLDTQSGGWYSDGQPGRPRDYYAAFAIHWYSLVHRSLAVVGRDDDRHSRIAGRAQAFAEQFQHWFAADGAAVPFGRGLGYRCAQGAFWGATALANVETVGWGSVRGLAERNLDWWWDQPVVTEDGLLSVGYGYPNSSVVENYMAGGSPYWATKHFLPLALASDHPFWSARPEAPLGGRAFVNAQPAPAALLSRSPDGDVVMLSGQDAPSVVRNGAAKYAKFAYSTRAGISVPTGDTGLAAGAFDSVLALSDDGGLHWRARDRSEVAMVDAARGVLHTRWRPWPDVVVDTWLMPVGVGHVRVHRLTSGRLLSAAEGGFSTPWSTPGQTPEEGGAGAGEPGRASGEGVAPSGAAVVSLIVDVRSKGGKRGEPFRQGRLVRPYAGSNLLFPRTVLPTLTNELENGEHLMACAVMVAGRRPTDEEEDVLIAAAADLLRNVRKRRR